MRAIRDQAMAWFVRMNSGDATTADEAEFAAWLNRHPWHRREYERLAGIWSDLDALPDPRREPRTADRLVARRRVFVGLSGLAIVGAAVPLTGIPTALASDFRTGTGERKRVSVSDGSWIELDAATAIAEAFTSARRQLRLIEGRALFSVADEPDRPFEVACIGGTIRADAPASAFVVHRRAEDVAVTVEAGAVSVHVGDGSADRAANVAVGQTIAYDAVGLGAVEPATVGADTAWRRGKLVFRDRPLDDVVADLNRYRAGRLVIIDRSLAQLRLDGIFDTARPDAALEAMINTLPVRAIRLTDYLVMLRRAAS